MVFSEIKHSKYTNAFGYLFLILFLSSEVARCGTEAALDAGHALHLAMRHIVVELGIRGAGGIVADAGKLTYADVVVCL